MMYDHEREERHDPRPLKGAFLPDVDNTLWNAMESYLHSRELSFEVAKANNWFPSSDAMDYAERIVMPATNPQGLGYWQARAMDPKEKKRYQSPPVPRGQSVIQVWPLNQEYVPILCLTEGPMDALAIAELGYRAVALMGANPTDATMQHIRILAEDVEQVVYVADRDALEEAKKFVIRCVQSGLYIILADTYPYKDFAAIPAKTRRLVFKNQILMSQREQQSRRYAQEYYNV